MDFFLLLKTWAISIIKTLLIVPVLKPTTGVELVIQKTAEATGGFIGKKIADKITKISKQHSHII